MQGSTEIYEGKTCKHTCTNCWEMGHIIKAVRKTHVTQKGIKLNSSPQTVVQYLKWILAKAEFSIEQSWPLQEWREDKDLPEGQWDSMPPAPHYTTAQGGSAESRETPGDQRGGKSSKGTIQVGCFPYLTFSLCIWPLKAYMLISRHAGKKSHVKKGYWS